MGMDAVWALVPASTTAPRAFSTCSCTCTCDHSCITRLLQAGVLGLPLLQEDAEHRQAVRLALRQRRSEVGQAGLVVHQVELHTMGNTVHLMLGAPAGLGPPVEVSLGEGVGVTQSAPAHLGRLPSRHLHSAALQLSVQQVRGVYSVPSVWPCGRC